MEKIKLTQEKETLLIPLYGKAMENAKARPILMDPKAAEVVRGIDYPFENLHIPNKTNTMMCLRASLFDRFTRHFVAKAQLKGQTARVLHLGCGLDSRCLRAGSHPADWYDLDFPEVIEIRRHFFKESEHYHLIPSSVTDLQWLSQIPQGQAATLVVAEGLLMYLSEGDIQALFKAIGERVGGYTLIFDAFNAMTAKRAANHPSLRRTGAVIQWGVDKPESLEAWGIGLKFQEPFYLTDEAAIKRLGPVNQALYRFAGRFAQAREAHRLLAYVKE